MTGMSTPAFSRVLVPLEFIIADRDEADAIEAGGYRLVVPPSVRQCIETGAKLAADGTLRLVHATPSLADAALYGGPEGTWMPVDSIRDLDERARVTSTKVLEDLARKLAPGVKTEVHAAPGIPTDVILAEAESFGADLIVLATSGRGRARRFFLGSTTDKVVRQANCPVLVIPSHGEP